MEAAEVFYNREDLWQFPRQPGGDGIATMAPYYIIMRLPGEPQAEFFLMLPMVPSRRDNMIAWLAACCDPPDYGKLIVYEFPKEKLVYGPFQIALSAALYFGPGAASSSRATSSGLKTTGILRGSRTKVRCRAISGRSRVTVKKKRSAATEPLMLGARTPVCV